jgi:nucleobase transporter 1/2
LIGGIIGKFGAILTLIPTPIIGGTLTVLFGMVAAVGISVLQFIDLSSIRNLTILGFSFILGLSIPDWISEHPDKINTGAGFTIPNNTVSVPPIMGVGINVRIAPNFPMIPPINRIMPHIWKTRLLATCKGN